LSLGIDLIPPKTCTYDCLYCQVGRTSHKTVDTDIYVPTGEVIAECETKLESVEPDVVTLAGSGEPTLHSEIDRIIASLKTITAKSIVLLTNGSLLWDERVRYKVRQADIILPTLSTANEKTFQLIHRPHPNLGLSRILAGYKTLRQEYKGLIFLEVVLLAGINDSEEEVEALEKEIKMISPDRIQLNTVVRPPADSKAQALDMEQLEVIKGFLGDRAEIVVDRPRRGKTKGKKPQTDTILEMARRRPVRMMDIEHAMGLSREDVEGLIKGLRIKGFIRSQEQSGETYYLAVDVDKP
jgi:wyosine [tRNA(Phe)-imidazoG37] synthetase (radical SAM superfamily)